MTARNYNELLETKSALERALVLINRIIKDETSYQDKGEAVVNEICRYSKISELELTQTSRKGGLVFYKRIACFLLADYCKWSLQRIADRLGVESHVTALHHRNKMRTWMKEPRFAPTEIIAATNNIINNLGL
jgi:chromosomal replication initiation ATPase DnaA